MTTQNSAMGDQGLDNILDALIDTYLAKVTKPRNTTELDAYNKKVKLIKSVAKNKLKSRDQQIALTARKDENAKWKVVAEEIVDKDGVYRAVNYLNKRSVELLALKQAQNKEK